MSRKVCIVCGVGAGIGGNVALKFAKENYDVVIIARNQTYKRSNNHDKLTPLLNTIHKLYPQITVLPIVCDVSKREEVERGFKEIKEKFGEENISVLVYNVGIRKLEEESICDVSIDLVNEFFQINAMGALMCMKEVLPAMLKNKNGCIILTGATGSLRGSSGMASFAMGKFALRALAQAAAREFGSKGIHVVHVIVDGVVDIPLMKRFQKDKMNPSDIADCYYFLATQSSSSATFELDLRPLTETIANL